MSAIGELPTPRQCAGLFLLLIESRESDRKKRVTRARFSELTLKRLWGRQRLTSDFLSEVQERLLLAGWVLMFAGSTYAAIRTSIVESWVRLSSKRISVELEEVRSGDFDFFSLERFWHDDEADTDAEEPDDLDRTEID